MAETQRLIDVAWAHAYRFVAGPDTHGRPVEANLVWVQLTNDLKMVGLRLDLRPIDRPRSDK